MLFDKILTPFNIQYINDIAVDHTHFVIKVLPSLSATIDFPYADIIQERIIERKNTDLKNTFYTVLPNRKGTRLLLVNVYDQEKSLVAWHSSIAKWFKRMPKNQFNSITIDFRQCDDYSAQQILRVVLAHFHPMPNYQSKHKDNIPNINIIGKSAEIFEQIKILHYGNAIGRYLGALPTNYLTPEIYIKALEAFAKYNHYNYLLFDKTKLVTMGAGAFSAVARASQTAGIVKLSYRGKNSHSDLDLTLVGKGVCFDTGGVALKQPQYMVTMNEDMMGSSVALGAFYALAEQKLPLNIDCYLAIVQNNIDKDAFLPNEVVTALNGKTIEVIDTDAEGRMILADALALASMDKPTMMIDFATLTGASVRSIGTEHNAIFSNYEDWYMLLVMQSRAAAEPAWPFPMDESYAQKIKSKIADLKQCQVIGNTDHILAAKFLSNFVDDSIRWLHIDISAANNEGGVGAITTDITGTGVWFANEVVKDFFDKKVI